MRKNLVAEGSVSSAIFLRFSSLFSSSSSSLFYTSTVPCNWGIACVYLLISQLVCSSYDSAACHDVTLFSAATLIYRPRLVAVSDAAGDHTTLDRSSLTINVAL